MKRNKVSWDCLCRQSCETERDDVPLVSSLELVVYLQAITIGEPQFMSKWCPVVLTPKVLTPVFVLQSTSYRMRFV